MSDEYADLHRLFTRFYSPNEHERTNAANLLYAAMVRSHIHVNDIKFVPARGGADSFERARTILETELRRTATQLAYARRHLDDNVIREMDRIGGHINRWSEAERLFKAALAEADGVLPKDWKRKLSDLTGEPPYVIDRWQEGLVPVPDTALAKLNGVEAERKKGWNDLVKLARRRWKDDKKPWRPLLAKLVGVTDSEVARWESGADAVPEIVFVRLRVPETMAKKPQKPHEIMIGKLLGGRQSWDALYDALNVGLDIDPSERKRHPIAARMSDLVTGRLFGGKPLVKKIKIRTKVYEFELTPYGHQMANEWGVTQAGQS